MPNQNQHPQITEAHPDPLSTVGNVALGGVSATTDPTNPGYDDWDLFEGDYPEDLGQDPERFQSYYVQPEITTALREADGMPPIDPDLYNAWLEQLPPEEREIMDQQRQHIELQNDHRRMVHDKIAGTVPELYAATLPPELAEALGDVPFAIGLNQTMASSIDEAREYLGENNGVDITSYNFHHRFEMFDTTMDLDGPAGENLETAVDAGYTQNSRIGRFVGVFPIVHPEEAPPGERPKYIANMHREALPNDLEV